MTRRISRLPLAAAVAAAAISVSAQPQAKAKPHFVYAGDASFAPYDYLDSNARPAGFNVELIRALAADAGVEVEVRLGEWDRARADFDAGRVDLISLSYSEERARAYLWLARTWVMHQCIVFRSRPGGPPEVSALGSETIAVQERSAVAELLATLPGPRPKIIQTSTQDEAIRLLADGVATGVGGNELTLERAAARQGIVGLVSLTLKAAPYGLMSQKGRGDELAWVARSLAHLRDAGTIEALAEKHLGSPEVTGTNRAHFVWILSIVATAVSVALVGFLWNRSLRRRVRARTRRLEETLQDREAIARSLMTSEDRYKAFLSLSQEGIVRLELDEPMKTDLPEEAQIDHILKTARIGEANRAFASMVLKENAADLKGLRIVDVAAEAQLREGLTQFVRSGYQLSGRESAVARGDGRNRWASANVVGVVENGLLVGIWLTQQDITERKRAEEDLRARGRVLDAVGFASARLLQPGSWQDRIPQVLARLGEATDAGCAYILENFELENGAFGCRISDEWARSGVPKLRLEPAFQAFQWPDHGPVRILLENRQPAPALVRDLPKNAQEFLGRVGLKSILAVPIFVEDEWWGLLGFGEFEYERMWSDAEIEALKTAAAALGASLLREQVEESVRASEKKYRDIFNFAPTGIYQATRDGDIITANLELAHMLGYDTVDEVLKLNMARDVYFDPGERERLIAKYEARGHGARIELRLKTRDGSPFWAEMSAHSIKGEGGETVYFQGFVQDIGVRKTAENEVRASEERYRLLFDGNPLPMLVYDLATLQFLAANEAAIAQYGYSRDELLRRKLPVLSPPGEDELAVFLATRFEPRPALVRVGLREQLRRDGSSFEVDVTSLALSFAGREARLLLLRDVTAERKTEAERERLGAALERAAEEWHRTFDSVDAPLLVLDREGRLTRINRAARELLGRDFAELLAHTLDEIGTSEPWRSAALLVDMAKSSGVGGSAQAVEDHSGRTWDVTTYLAPAGHGGEERIILVVRDISRVVALQESLRHSETMSAMGSLVAGVAHEVRNPLFSISATVDALESELGGNAEYAELTQLLRSQVNRLRQLMRDLLDYGKPPILRRSSVHPREILRRAARGCATLAREREVTLVEDVAEDAPHLNVDAGRMEQVFQNLIANAIQHSPREGAVRAAVRLNGHAGAPLEFTVEDDGTGLLPAEIPHLFEPFFSRRKGGTGLGLSVVQRIVEAHGGRVSASNREGGGALFLVRLPREVLEKMDSVHG